MDMLNLEPDKLYLERIIMLAACCSSPTAHNAITPHPTHGEAQRADGANSSLLLYSMKAQFSIHSTLTKNNHFDTVGN